MNSMCGKQFLVTWSSFVQATCIPPWPLDDLAVHIATRTFICSCLIVRNQLIVSGDDMSRDSVRNQKSYSFELPFGRLITIIVAHKTNCN